MLSDFIVVVVTWLATRKAIKMIQSNELLKGSEYLSVLLWRDGESVFLDDYIYMTVDRTRTLGLIYFV